MGNNIGKDNKMLSELFIAPQINCELMIPPNSREEYLKLLESDIGEDKKLEYLEALLEIYRLENLKNGDKNTEVACREMIGILHKQALNPKLNEQVAYLLIREGAYSEKVHNYENAVRFYESCLSFDVKDPDFRYFRLNNLAFCLNFMSRFAEAEKFLREAIEIAPERYNAWKNLGVSLEHQVQFEEAAECYLRAVTVSRGERRSVMHLLRLIERCPTLKKIPEISDFVKVWAGD